MNYSYQVIKMNRSLTKEEVKVIRNNLRNYYGDVVDQLSFKRFIFRGKIIASDVYCGIHKFNFKRSISNMMRKNEPRGCKFCGFVKNGDNFRDNTKSLIKKSIKLWGNKKWNYSKLVHKGSKIKSIFICNKCGTECQVTPKNHLQGNDCWKCSNGRKPSKAEEELAKFFDKHGIQYERQKALKGCINIRTLTFDFYLPESNICIELDGEQHTEIIERFATFQSFVIQIKCDRIKNIFCAKNGIKLLRIPYHENNPASYFIKLLKCPQKLLNKLIEIQEIKQEMVALKYIINDTKSKEENLKFLNIHMPFKVIRL